MYNYCLHFDYKILILFCTQENDDNDYKEVVELKLLSADFGGPKMQGLVQSPETSVKCRLDKHLTNSIGNIFS